MCSVPSGVSYPTRALCISHQPPPLSCRGAQAQCSWVLETVSWGGWAVVTLLPGSCGEFLPRLPSSKRLCFTESSDCRGFPTLRKVRLSQKYLLRVVHQSINKHLLTVAALTLEQGECKHRPCPSKGHCCQGPWSPGGGGVTWVEKATQAKPSTGKIPILGPPSHPWCTQGSYQSAHKIQTKPDMWSLLLLLV